MSLQARFRALYGAGPLNLLVLVASFAIAAAAVVGWFQQPKSVVTVLLWFVAAIVLHDMVALPLYSLLDRIAFGRMPAGVRRGRRSVPTLVDPTPYLRIPAILSGLLLIVFLPVVFGLGTTTEESASGIPESGYAARWLLAVGVMFVASGVAYAVGTARARAAAVPAAPAPSPGPPAAPAPAASSDPAAPSGPAAAPAPAAPSEPAAPTDPATPPNPPAPPPS